MKKSIILAAGSSKRLEILTKDMPKCLLQLNGSTILNYQLDALKKADVDKVYIVTGYMSEMIEERVATLANVIIVKNDKYLTTDNAYSLLLALKQVDSKTDSVIVLDGDIIFDPELLIALAESEFKNVMIVDNTKTITDEDCKVNIRNGYATAIGKQIDGQAVYTSMIKMAGEFLQAFKVEIQIEHSMPEWYSQPLNRLIISRDSLGINEMHIIYSGKLNRCEVDTLEDLINARKIYKMILEKHSKDGSSNR